MSGEFTGLNVPMGIYFYIETCCFLAFFAFIAGFAFLTRQNFLQPVTYWVVYEIRWIGRTMYGPIRALREQIRSDKQMEITLRRCREETARLQAENREGLRSNVLFSRRKVA